MIKNTTTYRAHLMLILLAHVLPAVPALAAAPDQPAGTGDVSAAESTRILVAYYSMTGNTQRMAVAVAEGARRVDGTEVVVKKVDEISKEDLTAADGIVLGAPTYFANMPGKMKTAIDDWNWKMKVDFTDKVGGAFATGGGQMGGKEQTVVSLLLFMINNRMVVAGPLYSDAEGDDKWAEVGAGAMTGPIDPGVGDAELDSAHRLGERIARLAKKMSAR
jgi:NAD(P)H dehydrogenase (quinone)